MPRDYFIPAPVRLAQLMSRTTLTSRGCRTWNGYLDERGYSKTSVHGVRDWTHRHVYRLAHGEIPAGLSICHKCDVPACIEPSHLFLGTRKENMQDALAKGRTARGFRLPQTKLSEADRKSILVRARRGEKYADIAKDFGVHKFTPAIIARASGIYRNRSKRS